MDSTFIVSSGWDMNAIRQTLRVSSSKVYYMQAIESQKEYARKLHERIRREFPEVDSRYTPIYVSI